jgi:hypothetical protein
MYLMLAAAGLRAKAQEMPDASMEDSLKSALQYFDSTQSTRYIAAFKDLNGDGNLEAIVYLVGEEWCGSGGCTTLILDRKGASWKIITKITVTRPPISILPEAYHGWHSIGVWVQGGGVHPGYEASLRFDGKSYPRNPSIPPASRMDKPDGVVVISSAEDAKPLH